MDMQIDGKKVRTERKIRAWSQEHLAEVTGLGLRTIQRIESTDSASFESVKAIAAVLEIDAQQLVDLSPPNDHTQSGTRYRFSLRPLIATLVTVIGLSSALFLASTSWAEQILLDIDLSYQGEEAEEIIESQLLTAEGKEAEVRINDVIRVIVSPTVEDDGDVFLDVSIFEAVGDDYQLLFEPKMITADRKEAEVRVTGETGRQYRILITPHRSSSIPSAAN